METSGNNHENFGKVAAYPVGASFFELVRWHMRWGTRPTLSPDERGEVWNDYDLGSKIGVSHETVASWHQKGRRCFSKNYNRLEMAFFGTELAYKPWRDELYKAWDQTPPRPNVKKKKAAEASKAIALERESNPRIPICQTDIAVLNICGEVVAHHQVHKIRAEPINLNQLLRTDLRATTLVGRAGELKMLRNWLAQSDCIAVKCIIGGAGSGKTRLAIEVCEGAEADGWFATFLPSHELQNLRGNRGLTNWIPSQPTLFIVDYAATSTAALKRWFSELAPFSHRSTHKLRILLLERHADRESGWWADLLRPDSNARATSADLIGTDVPYALPPLDAIRDRRALLAEVMAKAAPLFDPPRRPITPPAHGHDPWFDQRLSDNGFETGPLYLMMTGICAAESGASSALAMNRLGLAQHIAVIEQERLRTFALARGFTDDGKLLHHIAACITLQNGCELSALPSLIKAERQALDLTAPFDDETVAGIICDFLPVVAQVEPIRPDLIGESFCLPIIEGGRLRAEPIRHGIVLRCWERDPTGTTDTLIRCACDLAEGAASHIAIVYLRKIIEKTNYLEQLEIIRFGIPADKLSLRELSLDLEYNYVNILNSLTDKESEYFLYNFAKSLNNSAISLGDLGRPEEALAAAEHALALYQQLAAERPDAFIPGLAMALHNSAVRLGDFGRREEAIAQAEQSLALYRQLAAERSDAFTPDLAIALDTVAIQLSGAGRRVEALAAAREALALYRQLATQRPDAFTSGLARALHNFAAQLSDLGRRVEALAAAGEALALYRQLVTERPDAFTPDLATALSNFSTQLSDLGHREKALAVAEEALALYRQLATERPDAFTPGLARALNTLAIGLSNLGRREEALIATEEALPLYRQLATERPDAFTLDLATALNNFATQLFDFGRREEEVAAAEEALTLYRQLVAERASSPR